LFLFGLAFPFFAAVSNSCMIYKHKNESSLVPKKEKGAPTLVETPSFNSFRIYLQLKYSKRPQNATPNSPKINFL
jgi:hypothetical protein